MLVVVSLLTFYALLALTLFKNQRAALLVGSVYVLVLLVNMGSWHKSPGSEVILRITEGKFVVRFVFMPLPLSLTALYLGSRRLGVTWPSSSSFVEPWLESGLRRLF